MRIALLAVVGMTLLSTVHAQQPPVEKLSPMGEKIEAAMKSDIRSAAEKARDEERKPRQKLEFFGLREDMRVVELVPGSGWFTKIMAPVLADKGQLYLALGTTQVEALARSVPALSKAKVLPLEVKMTPVAGRRGQFDLTPFSLGVQDIDLALTFRNLHNFSATGRAELNKAVFAALKPGGHYGVVDHTRRHNEPDNPENSRRLDPVLVIKEIQAAGFVLEDFSPLHFKADDELRYEVGRKSVTGNSDRFMLLFRKPQ